LKLNKIKQEMNPLANFKYCPICGSKHFVDNDARSKRCLDCGFTFYLNAASAVAALIVNDKDELLLCQRKFEPYKGTLDLPGGFVEFDETAEEAVAREVKEEVGGEVISAQYFGTLPNTYPYSDLLVHTLDMTFVCKLKDYNHLKPADDASELMFVPLDEVDPSLVSLVSIRHFIEMFLAIHQKMK